MFTEQLLYAGGHTDEGEQTETHFLLQSHEVEAGHQDIQSEPSAGAEFLEGFQNESLSLIV